MKKLIAVFITILSSISLASPVQKLDFDSVWAEIYSKSEKKKAASFEREEMALSLSRAKRHWLPRIYGGAQMFSTNDPTQVFFNNLGQRSVTQSDFSPTILNRPGRMTFRVASLGLDLPIYEGGFKDQQVSMLESLVNASELETEAKRSEEYAESSKHYGSILIGTKNEEYLNELKVGLERIIAGYQVGSQNNPVGYSGLLGLKGVKNRIEGNLYDLRLRISQSRKWIDQKRGATNEWLPDKSQKLHDFLVKHLSQSSTQSYSSMLLANELRMSSLSHMKEMERSRFLPRVGLFAQNNIYSGNRDSANSQSYGLYLMWDIFNSDSYGRVSEANAKLLAAEAKLRAGKQDEKIALEQLRDSKSTLEQSLVLINDSETILKEQTLNAMKLFRSGMLTALQLAEVINRRVDLIENKNKIETQYLDICTRVYQLNN